MGIENPSFIDINSMIAQVASSLTASVRFPGSLNLDIKEIRNNLVPYPRFPFALCSYAPFLSGDKTYKEEITVAQLTNSAFESSTIFHFNLMASGNTMVSCNTNNGKYLACCLMYRGDVVPKDISAAIATTRSKTSVQFVDWVPTTFKCGLNSRGLL